MARSTAAVQFLFYAAILMFNNINGHQYSNSDLEDIKVMVQDAKSSLSTIKDTQIAVAQDQVQLLSIQNATLDQIALQSQMLNHTVMLQTWTLDTLNQVRETQHEMAGAYDQSVTLLETQSQQLQNISANTDSVASSLEKERDILLNISQSLPLVLDLQAKHIEVLRKKVITDCTDLASQGATSSGIYTIHPYILPRRSPFDVYCHVDEADGTIWTVIQRRYDGSVDFYRKWHDYERGFGNLDGEFWAGLDLIRYLTSSEPWELKILLDDFNGGDAYAHYSTFSVGDAGSHYRLTVGGYVGCAGDSMRWHNGRAFTTRDRDNDLKSSSNCAEEFQGAWWYNSCYKSNLNGRYLGAMGNDWTGMTWEHWRQSMSLKSSTMMIRPPQ